MFEEKNSQMQSVDELMYRRSRAYATKLYHAYLESTHQPKPTKNAHTEAQIDDIQARLIKEHPYHLLISCRHSLTSS